MLAIASVKGDGLRQDKMPILRHNYKKAHEKFCRSNSERISCGGPVQGQMFRSFPSTKFGYCEYSSLRRRQDQYRHTALLALVFYTFCPNQRGAVIGRRRKYLPKSFQQREPQWKRINSDRGNCRTLYYIRVHRTI